MLLSNTQLQKRYEGFLQTKLLWKHNKAFSDLCQLEITKGSSNFLKVPKRKLRLGQLAEQFVFNQLISTHNCDILAKNIQIQQAKNTIGELDAIIKLNSQLYHLEIVYKFYLLDKSLGKNEIAQWIGPNRNDSLIQKISKLRDKQLPLLFSDACKKALDGFNINLETVQQVVHFKAQLFIPYQYTVTLKDMNQNCIEGFYINFKEVTLFSKCQFYIPEKLDWFLKPFNDVEWMSYKMFISELTSFVKQNKSPLTWIRTPEDTLFKCFVVWW